MLNILLTQLSFAGSAAPPPVPAGFAVANSAVVGTGARLPVALQAIWPERFPTVSAAKRACRRSLIRVDGHVGSTADDVREGATIEVIQRVLAGPAPGEGRRARASTPLRVCFEDEALAIVYKPAGVDIRGVRELLATSVQPCRTASMEPLWRVQHVHRLDQPTSGLLVAAKTQPALSATTAAFRDRTVRKRYRALVAGRLGAVGAPAARIDAPLSGQVAVTEYSPVSHHPSRRYGEITLVDLWPITGRTHQLRRHLLGLGHPILGDEEHWPRELARDDADIGPGLCLSAVQIELPHPLSGERLSVRTEQPAAWEALIAAHVPVVDAAQVDWAECDS